MINDIESLRWALDKVEMVQKVLAKHEIDLYQDQMSSPREIV